MLSILTRPWPVFLLRKASELLAAFLALVVLTFAIVHLIPGDAARVVAGQEATPQQVEDTRHALGLDQPLINQFWDYFSRLMVGDLGDSFRTGQPVSDVVLTRLPFTASLALFGIALSLVISLALGLVVAGFTRGNRNRWLDSSFAWLTAVVLALPVYVIGALLVVTFAVSWQMLPAAGASSLASYVLPVLAISSGPIAAMARLVRREAAVVLEQDYMRTARGWRLSRTRQFTKHAVPNLLASTLTLSGLILASMIGGAILIENVFAWPGLGRAVVEAILERDYPLTRGIILTVGVIAVALNIAIDIILAAVDPRTLRAGRVLA